MDALDREILSHLQKEGRLSVTELAGRVGLSLSACHRRVRELEQSGAIDHYRAVVNPRALGLEFEAVVFVNLKATDPELVAEFEAAVVAQPNIVEAERMFGEIDYVLRVLATSLEHYQQLYDGVLGSLPGVLRLNSTLVMKRLHPTRDVPV